MKLKYTDALMETPHGKLGVLLDLLFKREVTSYQPKGKFKRIFDACFDIICQELDLTSDTRTVEMSFVSAFPNEPNVEGKTDTQATDPFRVALVRNMSFLTLIPLAHEMVHVRDLAKGYMVMTADDGMIYRGKHIHTQLAAKSREMNGLDSIVMPYEREAYKLQGPLVLTILEKLPADDIKWFEDQYNRFLPPTTLKGYVEKDIAAYQSKLDTANKLFKGYKAQNRVQPYLQQFDGIEDFY